MQRLPLILILCGMLPSSLQSQWDDLSNVEFGTILQIQFISPSDGWLLNLSDSSQGLLRTTDGGDTWAKILDHPPGAFAWIAGFGFLNDSIGYAVALNGMRFRTTNGGSTWDTSSTGGMNTNIKIFTPDLAYSGGGDRILKSTDTLRTWFLASHIPQASIFSGTNKLVYLNKDTIIACGGAPSMLGKEWTGTIECYRSTNGGLSWAFPHVDTLIESTAAAFSDDQVGYAFTGIHHVPNFEPHTRTLKTSNGGESWFEIPAVIDSGAMQNVLDVYFKNRDHGFVCGNGLARTSDGGLTWHRVSSVSGVLTSMSWTDTLHGWVAGQYGRLYRTRNGGGPLVSVYYSDNMHTGYSLGQNYPNPFNPSTTIKYDLALDAHVALKLYDILGREVETLIDEQKKAGNHSITFDASAFSSGIYFYRIQAGQFTQTKKLIVLR